MKKLYKLIYLALCIAIVCSFAACVDKSDNKNDDNKQDKKMLDIVLLDGQSNAVGFSPWSNGLKTTTMCCTMVTE